MVDRPSLRSTLQLDHRPLARIGLLYVGLILFGFSLALLIRSDLGLAPWDVFHQGVSERTGLSIGTVTIIVSGVVLLAWIPLRERLGVGTVSNAIVVGLAVDASLALLPDLDNVGWRVIGLGIGIGLNGVATGMYVGAGLGPGPRDGLMTGLAKPRRGRERSPKGGRAAAPSIRLVRTSIEVVVLLAGIVLGGTFGIGTIVFALAIGPLAQRFIPMFSFETPI